MEAVNGPSRTLIHFVQALEAEREQGRKMESRSRNCRSGHDGPTSRPSAFSLIRSILTVGVGLTTRTCRNRICLPPQ